MLFTIFSTILLVQLNVALSYGLEPRENNTVCPERHRCNRSAADSVRRYCGCDGLCEAYDDCCDDYARRSGSGRSSVHRLHNVTSCKHLKFHRQRRFHYVVDRCPKNFARNVIERNCRELNSGSDENTLTRVPVVGRQTTMLYRNVFCAICNGEQDVVFSRGRFESEHSRQTAMTLDGMTFLPPDGYNLRTCINVIRTCHPNYRDSKVKNRCTGTSQSNSFVNSAKEKYLSYVELMNGKRLHYRNADCAKCNFVNESKQMCSYERDEFSYGQSTPAYTSLIDFTQNTIQTVDSRSQASSLRAFFCRNGQFHDPIKHKCRQIFFPQQNRRRPRDAFE